MRVALAYASDFDVARPSTRLGKVEENDARRIADGRVVAGEVEVAGVAIDSKDGDVVTTLIATIKELTRWVEVEAAWIIPAGPGFPAVLQVAVGANRKDSDAVVQSVARINKFPIGRNQDFRAEVTAREAGRQRRNRLPGG